MRQSNYTTLNNQIAFFVVVYVIIEFFPTFKQKAINFYSGAGLKRSTHTYHKRTNQFTRSDDRHIIYLHLDTEFANRTIDFQLEICLQGFKVLRPLTD